MKSKTKIGILGGGFGGLYTIFYIKKYFRQEVEVTLFDKNNYLLYTPVLHEMAIGTVNARHVVIPIRNWGCFPGIKTDFRSWETG